MIDYTPNRAAIVFLAALALLSWGLYLDDSGGSADPGTVATTIVVDENASTAEVVSAINDSVPSRGELEECRDAEQAASERWMPGADCECYPPGTFPDRDRFRDPFPNHSTELWVVACTREGSTHYLPIRSPDPEER